MASPLKNRFPAEDYVAGIRQGDKVMLSRAITLVESELPEDRLLAEQVLTDIESITGNSIRIGITGVPGVGKSTFIETLGQLITSLGKKLAVLAIDPSSQKTKGSILGDKTRMEALSKDPNAYIRPTAARTALGGVASNTREAMLLCEAAGYEVIIIETVGVGQSETTVDDLTDFFLLLKLAGAGDELQGIKKGIVEMADLIAINKADGDNVERAEQARVDFQNALHMIYAGKEKLPKVITCSSLSQQGIQEIWEYIQQFEEEMKDKGFWYDKRSQQNLSWMRHRIHYFLNSIFYGNEKVNEAYSAIESKVLSGELSAIEASNQLITLFKQSL